MQVMTMKDLKVGWWGLLDAIYGPEEILEITEYALGPPSPTSSVFQTSNPGGIWPVLKFRVSDGRENLQGRNILRFPHEPVMAFEYKLQSGNARQPLSVVSNETGAN